MFNFKTLIITLLFLGGVSCQSPWQGRLNPEEIHRFDHTGQIKYIYKDPTNVDYRFSDDLLRFNYNGETVVLDGSYQIIY